jgi:hypothetical protein
VNPLEAMMQHIGMTEDQHTERRRQMDPEWDRRLREHGQQRTESFDEFMRKLMSLLGTKAMQLPTAGDALQMPRPPMPEGMPTDMNGLMRTMKPGNQYAPGQFHGIDGSFPRQRPEDHPNRLQPLTIGGARG